MSNLSIGQTGANGTASAVGIVINLAILWLMFGQKGKVVFSEH